MAILKGAYTWSDGTAVSFVSWARGEPTLLGTRGQVEECVEFDRTTGKWNDIDCFSSRGYICKAPKGSLLLYYLCIYLVMPCCMRQNPV